MKPMFRVLTVCAVVFGGAAGWAQDTAADAPPTDLIQQALDLGGKEVALDGVEVAVWKKRPLDAERVVQIGSQFIVLERGTGAVRAGWSETPGKIEVGEWSKPENLLAQLKLPPLPDDPEGFEIASVFIPTQQGVRVTGDPSGRYLYVLGRQGTVDRFDTQAGEASVFLDATRYLGDAAGAVTVQGLCFDDRRRMYLAVNVADESTNPVLNRVTIYRTPPIEHGGASPEPEPWLKTSYPWGGHTFNHGVANIAQGPDGMLYVGSGSRTDANEDFDEPNIADGGEVDITACLWRLDPGDDTPEIEIFARGLRNAYGFDWDPDGNLWATENGPNKNPPGELNVVEQGKHYGFPYRFSDWPANPYRHVAEPPSDLEFALPVFNVGPDAGGNPEDPLATFDAHSSPNGLAYLGDAFPASVRGAMAVARFGNQLGTETVGYDLLLVRPIEHAADDGPRQVSATAWITGMARPLDVYAAPTGRLYVLEHSREVPGSRGRAASFAAGRLLEIRPLD